MIVIIIQRLYPFYVVFLLKREPVSGVCPHVCAACTKASGRHHMSSTITFLLITLRQGLST